MADFGCAECKLLLCLKNVESLERVVGVDIDEATLEAHMLKLRPLVSDFICKRDKPLTMQLYCGSVSQYDSRMDGIQAVVMVELWVDT